MVECEENVGFYQHLIYEKCTDGDGNNWLHRHEVNSVDKLIFTRILQLWTQFAGHTVCIIMQQYDTHLIIGCQPWMDVFTIYFAIVL